MPPRLEVPTSSGRSVVVDSQVLLTTIFEGSRQIFWSHLLARALILGFPSCCGVFISGGFTGRSGATR